MVYLPSASCRHDDACPCVVPPALPHTPFSDGGAACILVLVDQCPAYLTMVARGFFLSFQVSHGRRKRA